MTDILKHLRRPLTISMFLSFAALARKALEDRAEAADEIERLQAVIEEMEGRG